MPREPGTILEVDAAISESPTPEPPQLVRRTAVRAASISKSRAAWRFLLA
jgi:hypothetical protein